MLWTLKRCLKGYMELDSLKYVKDWLEARYIKEYFIDKEQKYGFTKPELIKFIEKNN